jgi:hypothetical protein
MDNRKGEFKLTLGLDTGNIAVTIDLEIRFSGIAESV